QYFRYVLSENGVEKELRKIGAVNGDIVKVGDFKFEVYYQQLT
ncbi:MAG: Obg family GTPase CgtA, partial [Christensenellaceae bacterium]|nr:Obg family GTPase CgtA [Christensenellaceae bacterium]